MTTAIRINSPVSSSTRLQKLARTLAFITAAAGLVGLSQSASTTQAPQLQQSHPNSLTPQEWQDMKLDEYLRTYPNGNVLSLSEYAEQLQHPFLLHCGIGKYDHCRIPEYAYGPLQQTPDWWILTSTINWNQYTNFLSKALSSSGKLARDIVHHMLKDLVYEFNPETSLNVFPEMDLIRIILYPIQHGGNLDTTVSDRTETPDWLAAITPLATNANSQMDLYQAHQTVKSTKSHKNLQSSNGAPITNSPLIIYNSSQPVETNLHELSAQMEHLLAQSVENKVNSPISLDTGIYSAIAGGRFSGPKIQPARLSSYAEPIMRLIGVSAILNHQNSMVVVRKSSCAGYRDEINHNGHDRLQFCASDSSLIQIVNVRGNTIIKDIYNAHLIKSKYGFSTSFLASEALRCEQATQQGTHHNSDQHESITDSSSPFDVCTFQLPICNLQDEYLQSLLKNGKSIVEICREDVGLPI